jgi:serine/threonine protein kinase
LQVLTLYSEIYAQVPLSRAFERRNAYEILDAIGAGGMGELYRATNARLGRDVALKVVPEHLDLSRQTSPARSFF